MSDCQTQQDLSRAERMARYKEERRRQLAAQFGQTSSIDSSNITRRNYNKDANSSSSESGPRPTRASKLRAAAAAATSQDLNNSSSQNHGSRLDLSEKTPTSTPVNGSETKSSSGRRLERDKSSKRKSNLNRSLNSEEVPSPECGSDAKTRRQRRRFFPPEVLDNSAKESSDDRTPRSDNSVTASILSQTSTSPITASSTTNSKLVSRKSELSIHMENARRGIAPAFSEMGGRYKPTNIKKQIVTSSPKEKTPNRSLCSSDQEDINGFSSKLSNKENIRRKPNELNRKVVSDDEHHRVNKNITKRMEELTAYTKETLARVERLANKNKESPKRELRRPLTSSPIKQIDNTSQKSKTIRSQFIDKNAPSSILKKKSLEEPVIIEPVLPTLTQITPAGPVSILKRKITPDEHNKSETHVSTNHTPPVTFSPSVVEPTTTNRKQGILKKRRSLDESQVMRHRSCSPDVAANKSPDSRSILKNQRRSSLEELTRIQSPETHLQSILKRKTSRCEDDDYSLNSPQGILKRKSGASSAGSTSSTPHVSITTAVILAAAGGAEMVLDSDNEPVKPILKKKSFSEEYSYSESSSDAPKPILKKKSSTDTDDCDEKPKRPILKLPRSSLDREPSSDTAQDSRLFPTFKHTSSSETECEVKPILKMNSSREELPTIRPRLSFCGERSNENSEVVFRQKTSRRSHTICTDFNVDSNLSENKEEDRTMTKPRPLSVFDLVMSFEKSQSPSTGAIPKRNVKRNSDRYRTQPVTPTEVEESLNLVKLDISASPSRQPNHLSSSITVSSSTTTTTAFSSTHLENHSSSLLDFTSSLENDSNLNSFLLSQSSLHNVTSPDNGVCGKMSSDSAFQSLGDGLELDQEEDKSQEELAPVKSKGKLEPSKLESQMKAIAEEAKKMRLGKGNTGIDKYRNRKTGSSSDRTTSSRFSTQPVTLEEVQEAARINKPSGSGDDGDVEKSPRSILKSKAESPRLRRDHSPSSHPKSALKKRDSLNSSNRRSILKTEITDTTHDEGISCNDSGSDSDKSGVGVCSSAKNDVKSGYGDVKRNASTRIRSDTSDGESSGGREVRSIFRNDENKLRIKNTLESVLSKSRSQGRVGGDDVEIRHHQKTSQSHHIRRSQTQADMPQSISDRQAQLKKRGESGWRERIPQNNNATDELKLIQKNRYNDELSSSVKDKKNDLNAASEQWRSRVEKPDSEKLLISVDRKEGTPLIQKSPFDNNKRTPQPKRFKGKEGSESSSTPVSPEKNTAFDLTRSRSVLYSVKRETSGLDSATKPTGQTVKVPKPDDDTFTQFYKSVEVTRQVGTIEVSLDDLDAVQRDSLLVQKKNVQVRRRRGASKNPIKALANRTDISNEYTEVITGVAEREKRRLNIEKLALNSDKAIEALAGLASKEDFKSVALKKKSQPIGLLPYKELMLLQIKGRRHVQTRLVEPVADSINEGDNFILITPTALYKYVGANSNVIEQSRASDIAIHIQKTGDMGCKVDRIITVDDKTSFSKDAKAFWKLLGAEKIPETISAGDHEEDTTFESNILSTNMFYYLENNELVPLEEYWGKIPKIAMLEEKSVIVLDFGSEMYFWSGKNANMQEKQVALKLAKEMWEAGYDYTDCSACPLNVASILGDRSHDESCYDASLKSDKRPDWALFAKLTQHRETVLFREKFLDWPDFTRIIRVKSDENIKSVSPTFDFKPCDVTEMLSEKEKEPDLIIEGTHLGRGDKYFDEETRRLFQYDSLDLKMWRILESTYEELDANSSGQFFDGDSYIYKWTFRKTVKGRELNGKPSKHAQVGRDRVIFFYWQGSNASINEKGAAAFLTVELDKQSAPQLRVVQGSEPAAFLRLFNGNMVVHHGKRGEMTKELKPRLFIIRGEVEDETYMMEVPCHISHLRSRSVFILLDEDDETIIIWQGVKSTKQKKNVAQNLVERLMKNRPEELFTKDEEFEIKVMKEGDEESDFFEKIGGDDRSAYVSLLGNENNYDYTMRMYYMNSITGTFMVKEVLCPHRSEHSSPYPFVQSELYSASQPALFLIDNHHELWLWQGWWPEKEDENAELSDQTGSGATRFHAERRAAMQTAVNYWRDKNGETEMEAHLVWAGLEPLEFKNLFPTWEDREDVAELNIKEGKKPNDKINLEQQLALLSRTTFSLEELLQRPLPEGVDPTHLEKYLSSEDFQNVLAMTKEEFHNLPSWKKTQLKKDKGLF